MAIVHLRGPLRALAGGERTHELEATSVLALLRELERAHPNLRGWILDERGTIRRHINIFVDGEQAQEQSALHSQARVDVLPAITGG